MYNKKIYCVLVLTVTGDYSIHTIVCTIRRLMLMLIISITGKKAVCVCVKIIHLTASYVSNYSTEF